MTASPRADAQNSPDTSGMGEALTILYSFPHRIGAPGIGWTAWNQVQELALAGHKVHLVAASVERQIAGLASVHETLVVAGRRVPHRAIGRDRALAWHDGRAARVLERLAASGAVDVVHAWPLGSAHTLEAAARLGIAGVREAPNTHTAHAYEVVAEENALLGLTATATASHSFNAAHLALEEREWAAATGVLAPSAAVEQSFLERGFAPDRILRHRYGYRPEPQDLRVEPVGVDSGAATTEGGVAPGHVFTAVFMGRGEPRKGLHYALRAWAASSASTNGRFLIYGSMDEGYRNWLEPLLAGRGVEVRGFTDDPAAVFAGADVLLLPTIEEGSALVSYEAQAAGCVPLVSTAAGADLEDGLQGFTHEPRDVAALTGQLDRLSTEPATLSLMSAAAVAHAPRLSWSAANDALVAAYRLAISRRRGSSRASETGAGEHGRSHRRFRDPFRQVPATQEKETVRLIDQLIPIDHVIQGVRGAAAH